MLIRIYDGDDLFQFIISYVCNQHLTLDGLFDIRMQTAHGKAKESEPDPEKRITLISKCTEGLGPSETCITVVKDKVSNEQGAAKTRQGVKRLLVIMKKFCRRARCVPRLQCLNSSCRLYC